MSLWEYKVITSGKGGFATPALLEKFLNDLGRDEWEIVHFQTAPDNFLAFTGLARRSTQRDWTLQDAAAAAAKAEAEKLRAEFEAKFRAASSAGPGPAEERGASFLEERVGPQDDFRKPVDTSHDAEPEAAEEEKDEWDNLTASEEEELPTFFEAIRPHMRRNQRGPGMSVGVDYLAKKWDQTEEDLKGALAECGFILPADEDAKPEYLEYDGDLYWLNINRRGELWINTREKPRPVFRPVKAARIELEPSAPRDERGGGSEAKPAAEAGKESAEPKPESTEASTPAEGATPAPEAARTPGAPLPAGAALLDAIRPHMRRNRRGPGGSGSTNFLSRALRTNEAELKAAFTALGLTIPASAADKPVYTEIGDEVWWLNIDSRGGLWINGRRKSERDTAAPAAEAVASPASAESAPVAAVEGAVTESGTPTAPAVEAAPVETVAPAAVEPAPAAAVADPASPLSAVRLLLKETKTGAVAANVERIAAELGKSPEELVATLTAAGLKVPEKPRERPVFVEHGSEILWFNRNAKGELWLNAKASKFADAEDEEEGDDEQKPRRSRSRGKKAD